MSERLAPAATSAAPIAMLKRVWSCWWWLLKVHVAERHGLPRDLAVGPPPARWLEGWPTVRR